MSWDCIRSSADEQDYHAYLYRHYWRRVVPVSVASGFGMGFALADLRAFSADGVSLLHPFIAAFIGLGCLGLGIIALTDSWTIFAHINPWKRP